MKKQFTLVEVSSIFSQIKGLPINEAHEKAKLAGVSLRIVRQGGQDLALIMNYISHRMKVEVDASDVISGFDAMG